VPQNAESWATTLTVRFVFMFVFYKWRAVADVAYMRRLSWKNPVSNSAGATRVGVRVVHDRPFLRNPIKSVVVNKTPKAVKSETEEGAAVRPQFSLFPTMKGNVSAFCDFVTLYIYRRRNASVWRQRKRRAWS
jgi:hypothetical protein